MLRMLGVTKRRAFSALLVLAGKPYHETNAKHVEEPYYHETRWYYYYYYFCPSEASNLSTPSDSTPRRSSLRAFPFPNARRLNLFRLVFARAYAEIRYMLESNLMLKFVSTDEFDRALTASRQKQANIC